MSYRKLILKRLKHFWDTEGPGKYLKLDPIDILGKPADTKYVAAINQLLAEKLILGIDQGGTPAFSLNPAEIDDIMKELSWSRNPTILFLVPVLIALAGLVWAVLKGK